MIADLSVNHVERCLLRCGYAAERVEKDYGLDLLMFTYAENGEIENGHVEMQLKATDSLKLLKDGRSIALEVSPKDLFYWEGEPWPVILIVYDATSDYAYWLYVQRDMSRAASRNVSGESATVHIPTQTAWIAERYGSSENTVIGFLNRSDKEVCPTMASDVTYAQLHTLLRELNFAEVPIESSYRAFHHTGSDTLIVLANREQASQAGQTDLVSVRRHLVENGIVEEDHLDELLHEGRFPQRD